MEPILEITGTFIPEEQSSRSDLSTASVTTASTTTAASEDDITEPNLPFVQPSIMIDNKPASLSPSQLFLAGGQQQIKATNHTFVIGNESIFVLTGQSTDPADHHRHHTDAFVLACGRKLTSTATVCDNFPISVLILRQSKHPNTALSKHVLYVDLYHKRIVIKLLSSFDESRIQFIQTASIGNETVSGIVVRQIDRIEVNKESKRIPISMQQSSVELNLSLSEQKPPNVRIIREREENENQSTTALAMAPIEPSSASLPSFTSTTVKIAAAATAVRQPSSKQAMHTVTVGNLKEFFYQLPNGDGNFSMESLQNYFPNRSIPTYAPTLVEVASNRPDISRTSTTRILDTSTIFGFIDFTTIVNNTLLIFTPRNKVENNGKPSRIEPTKVAIFHDLLTPATDTKQTTTPNLAASTSENLIVSYHEPSLPSMSLSTSTLPLSPPDSPLSSSMSNLDSLISFTPELSSSVVISSSKLPELMSIHPMMDSSSPLLVKPSASVKVITSDFILPTLASSFDDTLASSVPQSTPTLIPTTFLTKVTKYFTEEKDGKTVTKSNRIISTNVIYNSVNSTRPLKTYYTTYTYYTTFKNTETEFVHSREEIVTNLVDVDDEIVQPTTTATAVVPSFTDLKATVSPLREFITESEASNVDQTEPSSTSMASEEPMRSTVVKPLNKSYLGKLLSGIAVPITHYTTFTYYTTFFKQPSGSEIVSRTKVVSNIVTGTINLNQAALQKRSTEYGDDETEMTTGDNILMADGAENIPIVITPVTEFATTTQYTTFFIPGQGSTVVTNTQIFSTIYLPEVPSVATARGDIGHGSGSHKPISSKSSAQRLTEPVTRLVNGVPIVDNAGVVPPLLLPSADRTRFAANIAESDDVELIAPTVTRKKIVVTRTRKLTDVDEPRKSVVIVHGPPASSSRPSEGHDHPVSFDDGHQVGRLHPSVMPTPVTYYTTYTYFTTELINGIPVVRSNEHLFSTIITGKVLPTRVVPTLAHRVKRTAAIDLPSFNDDSIPLGDPRSPEEELNELTDNKIEPKAAKSENSRPTGVIKEITSASDRHTIITQIIGTLINGFYAQFAVTKTLEPTNRATMTLATIVESNSSGESTNSLNEDNMANYNEISDEEYGTERPYITTEQPDVEERTTTEMIEVMLDEENNSPAVTTEQPDNGGSDTFTVQPEVNTEVNTENRDDGESNNTATDNENNDAANEMMPMICNCSSSDGDDGGGSGGGIGGFTLSNNIFTSPTASTDVDKSQPSLNPTQIMPTFISTSATADTSATSSTPSIEVLPVYTSAKGFQTTTSSSTSSLSPNFSTGLIHSTVESITSANHIVRITKEVFGTYIAGIYAHLAKTRTDTIELPTTQTMAQTSEMVISGCNKATTTTTTDSTSVITSESVDITPVYSSLNLVTSQLAHASSSSEIESSIDMAAEVSGVVTTETLDSVKQTTGWPSLSGLSSVAVSTATVDQRVIVYTTEYYTTQINGFTAYYSRNTSEIVGTVSEQPSTTRPSIHFPTPVRFLFANKYSPNTAYNSMDDGSGGDERSFGNYHKLPRKLKEIYDSNEDYHEEPFTPSGDHGMPRSRTIREKDMQPVFSGDDADYDVDYADDIDNRKETTPTTVASRPTLTRGYGPITGRRYAGFGARVANAPQPVNRVPDQYREDRTRKPTTMATTITATNRGIQSQRRKNKANPVGNSASSSRSLDYYSINDYKPTNEHVPDTRTTPGYPRQRSRWRQHYSSTTTTTTPPPRHIPNQRLRNRKYGRNRNSQIQEHPMERVRHRGFTRTQNRIYEPLTTTTTTTSGVIMTPTVPKVPITITSIVTTVKTVPIFHGFRTSYATLTTTALDTSVIPTTAYETSVDEHGSTRTLYMQITDRIEPNKVTDVLVTTTALEEVKLVPIRFGYSTRTETFTDVKTFTMLTTVVNSFEQPVPPPGLSLLTSVTTFVTTQTLSSTTAVSLLLHGKTLVSTLTFTSLAEATVTKTETLTVSEGDEATVVQTANHAKPLVTMLTLSITGENGEVTELVTALTVPVQPLHTKVERDIRASSTPAASLAATNTAIHSLNRRHQIQLDSSNEQPTPHHHHNHNNNNAFISASFKTVDQFSETHPFFITTLFKGPKTEIYEASALIPDMDFAAAASPMPVFRKRKLQQFNENIYKEQNENPFSITERKPTAARKPSFQRVRIKQVKAPNLRASLDAPKLTSESQLNEFHRVMGVVDKFPTTPSVHHRRPVSQPQFNLYSSAPITSLPTSSVSYLLANNFQKPTFRKIKPHHNRRLVSSIRTVQPGHTNTLQPSMPPVFASRVVKNSNFVEISKVPNQIGSSANVHLNYARLPINLEPQRSSSYQRPVLKSRNHFNANSGEHYDNLLPPGANNEFAYNHLGGRGQSVVANEFYPIRPSEAPVHTPTIPLTLYTTFTYLTTVIRGQHTAHLSRESVTSTITTRALDKTIVEVVRDSDGLIEPTKVVDLGTKTKGATTTIYNALSQIQVYNEDLYNVIQKTYNKNIQFKPWKASSTYQPIFVTNHLDSVWPPRDYSSREYSSSMAALPEDDYFASSLYISPSRVERPTPETPTIAYHTPVLKGSFDANIEASSVEKTPVIESVTSSTLSPPSQSSSPLFTPAIRVSSSVLIRKPINSKYGYLYSRSRVRVRVNKTSSTLPPPASSSVEVSTPDYFPPLSPMVLSSSEIPVNFGEPLSKFHNRITKSKIVTRHRNQSDQMMSTIIPNILRVSSRIMRPSSTFDAEMVTSPVYELHSDQWSASSMLNTPPSDNGHNIEHSDAARANKFVKVSNGVTLIISSRVPQPTRPFTLEPTLVTGGAVHMKNIIPSYQEDDLMSIEAKKSIELSREPISPSTTVETVETYRTSTLYSTLTYYATLFNGTGSTITPIEDVKTEYITYPETLIVTRTVDPAFGSTKTLYTTFTNTATFYLDNSPVVSTMEQVVSNKVALQPSQQLHRSPTFTNHLLSGEPQLPATYNQQPQPLSTTTRSTHTTLTHFITLFHGTHTILSSIEEISPTVVTEVVGQSSTVAPVNHMPHIRFTQPSIDVNKQSKNLYGALVPSVSTLFTTHTYYTTLFSGTTSIIQSREETTHSLITLYVPNSGQSVRPTSAAASTPPMSSTMSAYVPDVTTAPVDLSTSMSGTTNGVVYFTNFILPSSIMVADNTIEQAKGPVNPQSPLLNHGELTVIDRPAQPTLPILPTVANHDLLNAPTQHMDVQPSNALKPGAIIELSDLLDGANLAGNIGEAIKDIVQILAKGQKSRTDLLSTEPNGIDRTSSVVQEMPPLEGATVSRFDDPVYIPIHDKEQPRFSSSSPVWELASSSIFIPPVAYVPSPPVSYSSTPLLEEFIKPSTLMVMPSFVLDTDVLFSHTDLPGGKSVSPKPDKSPTSPSLTSTVNLPPPASTEVLNNAGQLPSEEQTQYITSIEATPSTVVMSTTKVNIKPTTTHLNCTVDCLTSMALVLSNQLGLLHPRLPTDHHLGVHCNTAFEDGDHNHCWNENHNQHVQCGGEAH